MLTEAQITELIAAADAGDAHAEQLLLEAFAQMLREIAGD